MSTGFELVTSAHSSRLFELQLSRSGVDDFQRASKNIPMHLSRRTAVQKNLRSIFDECFGKECSRALSQVMQDRAYGGFICRLNLEDHEPLEAFMLAISCCIGTPYSGYNEYRCAVDNRLSHLSPEESAAALRSPYRPDPLHTDGHGFDDVPEEFLGIGCTHRIKCDGGASILLHLDDWAELDHFRKEAEGLVFSFQYYRQYSPGLGEPDTRRKPLFVETAEGVRMNYIPGYMRPDTERQKRLLRQLKEVLRSAAETPTAKFVLFPGDMYFIDNGFWLHGRTPLEVRPGLFRRLLQMSGSY